MALEMGEESASQLGRSLQEDGWAPGPVWTGAQYLDPARILSPDRQARSQSLYRLRYPAHCIQIFATNDAILIEEVSN